MFPPILAKYEVVPDPMDMGKTLAETYTALWTLHANIDKAQNATDDTPKVVHPFDTLANGDKKAAKLATKLLADFVVACEAAIADNPYVAFHLMEMDKNVTAFFTSEVQYYRHKLGVDDGVKVSDSTLDSMKSDRKELVTFIRNLLTAFPSILTDPAFAKVVKMKDGNVDLPSIRGRASQTGESEVPTGRYAKYLREVWTVDDETFPVGTDPRDILRAIYVGAERVGKRPSDLFAAFDTAKGKGMQKVGDENKVVFPLNGKQVTCTVTEG